MRAEKKDKLLQYKAKKKMKFRSILKRFRKNVKLIRFTEIFRGWHLMQLRASFGILTLLLLNIAS